VVCPPNGRLVPTARDDQEHRDDVGHHRDETVGALDLPLVMQLPIFISL
jgi:hypothetical protein